MQRVVLPVVLLVLSWGFWVSPDFKAIAAGVAIFLFGMLALEQGFAAFTGGLLEKVLEATTDRLWKSLTFGVVSTTLMQSSSLVSVITISFLSAGLITLYAGIGVIFGANLGTTTGAWLIAGLGLKVDIAAFAMPMLVFGIILVLHKHKILRGIGNVSNGLGFLFLGIHYMKEGFEAFRDTIDLTSFAVAGYPGLMLFALIGVVATVIMQSSHATLVLIITGLAAGQVTYENALALAIGANIGTTITAILGSMSANVEGKRLAAAHLIFNTVTAAIAIGAIHPMVWAVDGISEAVGIAADDWTLKLAVFHSLFNLIGIVAMLPFTRRLADQLVIRMPGRETPRTEPLYLHEAALGAPEAAIEAARKETVHLYDNAFAIIAHTLCLQGSDILSGESLEQVVRRSRDVTPYDIDHEYEQTAKALYNAIVAFVSRAQPATNPQQADELFETRLASRDAVEAIKAAKHLQKNLTRYMASDNRAMRDEYDGLRVRLARVLRQLHYVRLGRGSMTETFSLEGVKADMRGADLELNRRIEALLRGDEIQPGMATSLMNDSGYAYEVAKNLVAMAETIFAPGNIETRVTRRTARLDAIVPIE